MLAPLVPSVEEEDEPLLLLLLLPPSLESSPLDVLVPEEPDPLLQTKLPRITPLLPCMARNLVHAELISLVDANLNAPLTLESSGRETLQ